MTHLKTAKSPRTLGSFAGIAAAATVMSAPAHANSGFEDAHSLRSLDIMLMVTSLRCRTGAHDFQSDYHRFSATNLKHLNAASSTLKRTFVASYGERNPNRALDRMGVKIANSYGDGHPWLSCAELKQVTQELSQGSDAQSLVTNARYLLSAARPAPPHGTQVAALNAPESAARAVQTGDNVQITYNMTAQW